MNRIFRSAIFYLFLIIAVAWVSNFYRASADARQNPESVNEWVELVENGEIKSAEFLTKDEKVIGEYATDPDARYEVFLPHDTIDEFEALARQHDVEVSADPQAGSLFLTVLVQFLPIVLII